MKTLKLRALMRSYWVLPSVLLLGAALSLTTPAGRQWVRLRAESVSHPGGPRVRISVEDRGPGISPDDLPHIFDPFYRAEAVRNSQMPGVGLGLSLVKRIVEAHHGTVEVTSSDHAGAAFFLYLPAQSAPAVVVAEMKEAPL